MTDRFKEALEIANTRGDEVKELDFGNVFWACGVLATESEQQKEKLARTVIQLAARNSEIEQLRRDVAKCADNNLIINQQLCDTIEQLRKQNEVMRQERDDAVNRYELAFELGRKNVLDELIKKVNENGNA